MKEEELQAKLEKLQLDMTFIKEQIILISAELISLKKAEKSTGTIVQEDITMEYDLDYNGKHYKIWRPCKYKCGFWSGWGKPYTQGDHKLHINPGTKEIIGYECPKYVGGS